MDLLRAEGVSASDVCVELRVRAEREARPILGLRGWQDQMFYFRTLISCNHRQVCCWVQVRASSSMALGPNGDKGVVKALKEEA
jgi:hypothetical protein